jgi:hypothetical protein
MDFWCTVVIGPASIPYDFWCTVVIAAGFLVYCSLDFGAAWCVSG